MWNGAQSFAYEIKGDGAVILRCFSRDSRAEIPERIEGFPVTELGGYAFSSHFEEERLAEEIRAGRARRYAPGMLGEGPALCGERLEEIVLPPTIRRVGRYCFYNCGNLRRIEFHGGLSDWGSGAFTGCHGVRSLRVYTDADGRSHLKDVLDELREELEVGYFIGSGTDRPPAELRLIFPEFYEEGVENTPARILENHVHGSGILYRNCFRGRVFDAAQYDALFPHARAWESGELVLRMALDRLRFPHGLTARAREQYETYLTEHLAEAGKRLLAWRDPDGLRFLLEIAERTRHAGEPEHVGTSEDTGWSGHVGRREYVERAADVWLEEAARLQYTEAVSLLMERKRAGRSRPVSRRRLEL